CACQRSAHFSLGANKVQSFFSSSALLSWLRSTPQKAGSASVNCTPTWISRGATSRHHTTLHLARLCCRCRTKISPGSSCSRKPASRAPEGLMSRVCTRVPTPIFFFVPETFSPITILLRLRARFSSLFIQQLRPGPDRSSPYGTLQGTSQWMKITNAAVTEVGVVPKMSLTEQKV